MKSLYGVVYNPLPASCNIIHTVSCDAGKKKEKQNLSAVKNCLTNDGVVLERHFGQGQLFYKTTNCEKIKNKQSGIVSMSCNYFLNSNFECKLTCWSHQLSTKAPM